MERTQAEILAKIKEVADSDFFGVMVSDLLAYLDFEHAKEFIKEGTTEAEWKKLRKEHDSKYPQGPVDEIKDYMEFAFTKAQDERGLSAGRSIMHMQMWLWLDGKADLADEIEDYTNYGIPQLKKICQTYDIDPRPYLWED